MVQRGLIALVAGTALGLGVTAPALAATPSTLVSTGNATSVAADSADLNGVVYRDQPGARWLFEYSADPAFDTAVSTTTPVLMNGRLTAVERRISGLTPGTTYYWRAVLVVRSGTRTAQSFGATGTLVTTPAPAAASSASPAPAGASTAPA